MATEIKFEEERPEFINKVVEKVPTNEQEPPLLNFKKMHQYQ